MHSTHRLVLKKAIRFCHHRQIRNLSFLPLCKRYSPAMQLPLWNNSENPTPNVSSMTCNERRFSSHTSSSQSSYALLQISEENGLRKIVMNDKKTRNALSIEMLTELISAIHDNNSDPNLRCIIITAPKDFPVFSSGHNLKQLTSDNGVAIQRNILSTCTELMLAIRKSEVPVIAVVNGLAAAAGCQLVAACDFSIVTDKSNFSTPGANFGLFCSTPGVPLVRAANRSTSAFMLLTGQSINANEALNAGLVTKVVPEDKLDSCIDEIYSSVKSKSRAVINLGKQFFYEQLEMPYEKALREGENIVMQNLQFQDCQEGLKSFKEKRPPVWTHTDSKV